MSNLAASQLILDQIEDQGAFFNVTEDTLTTSTGIVIPGKKALINSDSKQVIGVVSEKYKTVKNSEVFESFSKQLQSSSLDLNGATVDVKFSHGGARTMVDITLPEHEVELRGGDKTQLKITTLNSYDGSWRFQSKAGGIRLACMNGQVLGDFISTYSERHTKRLSVEAGAESMVRMLQEFHLSKDWWNSMMSKSVDQATIDGVLQSFLTNGKTTRIDDIVKFESRPIVQDLKARYARYENEMGKNAWALYNTLTDYVTHREYSQKLHASRLAKNQVKLTAALKNPVFA